MNPLYPPALNLRCYYEGKPIPVGSIEFFTDGGYNVNDELPSPHAVIVRSTGMHDKHGEEVFEGDILRSNNGKARLSVVVWNQARARWLSDLNEAREDGQRYVSPHDWATFHQVIGNIYSSDSAVISHQWKEYHPFACDCKRCESLWPGRAEKFGSVKI